MSPIRVPRLRQGFRESQGILYPRLDRSFPPRFNLGPTLPPDELYSFSSFTFTNGTQIGRDGPSQVNLLNAYDTTEHPWLLEENFFFTVNGIQNWRVPRTGLYKITARGARGGHRGGGVALGGNGAIMEGVFGLVASQYLEILVGQMGVSGTSGAGGGGGGTFVVYEGASDIDNVFIIAGGGGGAGNDTDVQSFGRDASVGTAGTNCGRDATGGGDNGEGGLSGLTTNGNSGGGGGGFLTDGMKRSASTQAGEPGLSYLNGGRGGKGGNANEEGGFGGGGSTPLGLSNANCSAGAGGGFSGGAGGDRSVSSPRAGGGGGGSYNSGANQNNTIGNNTHGSVTIEFLEG